ncbi:hypothetical protein EC973_005503 [Apophysomyces ossiformis]|uniref:Uncharacterized protein n=1 Tax=Apophysomyces ossiformis TaxID=679940 RepID=A0A8H7BP81_9FUNG|nr:hypothetical protein EC973_005503 [Apophysomyces ossiformis]
MSNHHADTSHSTSGSCLLAIVETQLYEPQAEDILQDEDLLDLFHIVKQFLRKKPDQENLAKLFFCVSYALGDHVQFYKHVHEDRIVFRGSGSIEVASVQTPRNSSCCVVESSTTKGRGTDQSKFLSVSYLTNPSTNTTTDHGHTALTTPTSQSSFPFANDVSTDAHTVRPYTNLRPIYPTASIITEPALSSRPDPVDTTLYSRSENKTYGHSMLKRRHGEAEVLMEPNQRGFYYQDGRIAREPPLLQRYAEQGVLTQASLMRKRKRQTSDADFPYMLCTLPAPTKKPKIPHRHGEFDQRRDDIIGRMRNITMADLEQKSQRMSQDFSIAIDYAPLPPERDYTPEEAAELLGPSLRTLTSLSNMKPHQDNGMNQNGIYYNTDYFRLYLAFDQFQKTFARLFPSETGRIGENISDDLRESCANASIEKDKDRERNANMKAYRAWIEPLLIETNWAAFRRNIVVGERIFQVNIEIAICKECILLMTKELSGSKLHLTFTNNEWDEFINGLESGKWDQIVQLDRETPLTTGSSLLVAELRKKLDTHYWFCTDGQLMKPADRKLALIESSANAYDDQ